MTSTARKEQTRAQQHQRRIIIICLLFVFLGINLRSVILAVPPILPLIKQDLGLSYTLTGLLTSLPVLVMGAAAWPAGFLAGRMGARVTVALGLALLALGALLRAVWVAAFPLYLFTAVLSLGIALAQTAIPVLARQWFPTRIGLVSALFSDGLIVGEAIAAGITVPVILHALGSDAWAGTFVVWSIPVGVALILWLALAPPAPATVARPTKTHAPASAAASPASPPRRRVKSWHLGVLLGAGSLIFFGMNGWIANYNQAQHHAALTSAALAILNAAQIPVSLAMTPFAQQLAGRRWPFVAAGCVCLVAIAGWVLTPAAIEPLWAALLGGSSAFVFVLGIALPPLLASREQVARLTGITLTISYGVAFFGPLIGGALWDLLGLPALAFLPVALAGCALVILGALLPPRSHFGMLAAEENLPLTPGATIAPASDAH